MNEIRREEASNSFPIPGGWKPLCLFVGVFILYYLTRSPFLDEWDSLQFALGLRQFNLSKHQPHPPGYPLYLFPGWLGVNVCGWTPEFSHCISSAVSAARFS
jgi:hypothetical protein